jgi:hypothetical protein
MTARKQRSDTCKRGIEAMRRGEEIPLTAYEVLMSVEPDHRERAVLELATAIERAKNPDYSMVTLVSVDEAVAFHNEYGFARTLDRMFELEKTSEEKR